MKALEQLDQAKYFFEQMKLNVKDQNAFKHNLGAFLSSARSVTFVLQKEYAEDERFQKWYSEKQEDMRKDKLLRFFLDKRDYVIHESPIEPKGKVFITVYDTLTASESVTVTLKKPNGTEQIVYQTPEQETALSTKPRETETGYQWFFEDCPEKDILSLCEEYLKKLGDILEEANVVLKFHPKPK
jgi:hypothetical protein